ncbi:MAG TPA: hypothetical protein VNO14_11985 [Blastocatellia bacterium]|nr:hypothetical protein [Blastocatellia bacterium]
MTCCGSQQQGEKPAATFTSPPAAGVEDIPAVALPGRLKTAQAMRTHDPPRSRPLYVTNSCLLI